VSEQEFFGTIRKLVQIGAAEVAGDYEGTNAVLYDLVEQYTGDVPWYIEEARRAGGEVLELGCGTGRVLIPLAQAGFRVTGVDLASDMLAQCRRKLDREPDDVRRRVTLLEADMRRLSIDRQFALAILPLYTGVHLLTAADQAQAFAAIAWHLAPGGVLLMEALLDQGVREAAEPVLNVVRRDRDTGELLLVLHQLRREEAGVVLLNLLNVLIPADSPAKLTAVSSREARTTVTELRERLSEAGLVADGFWGDYSGGPLDNEARGVVVRAHKPRR